jgi:hypothetical protein
VLLNTIHLLLLLLFFLANQSCTRQFAFFQPEDLTRLLRALATLGLAPAQDWTELYFAKTYTTKESFNRFQKYGVVSGAGELGEGGDELYVSL